MTKQELIRELQEIANGHWMMARQARLAGGDRESHVRDAQIIEEAIALLERTKD